MTLLNSLGSQMVTLFKVADFSNTFIENCSAFWKQYVAIKEKIWMAVSHLIVLSLETSSLWTETQTITRVTNAKTLS